ncbi:MAG: flagellar basal body P-ring formation chaperone FlgA [Burkholderiales bacterium]|nr:flagellar basal body P-ring formation chaperone FlgA [Burkholderiales bacterium]
MKRCVLAVCAAAALAAPGAASPAQPAPEHLRLLIERAAGELPGRVEVSVGPPDARIDLSACARLEPFLPAGARPWGRMIAGVRCVEGPALVAWFPVHVRVFAHAPVAARALAAGTEIAEQDLRIEEVELTREPPGAILDPAAASGRVLARALAPGQLLRPEYLRARQAVQAGDAVRLVLSGPGFSISTDARALGTAAEGQSVRVQTATGRTLTGIARANRVVEIAR